jgi:catechol 2,3-dioxygenase-like lactoylglutathione lyase family enzyme
MPPTRSTITNMSPQLLVADLERSIEFYTRMLDFTLDFRYEDFYAGLTKEGFSIHLKVDNYSPEERQEERVEEQGPEKNQNLEITFSVTHIEHLYQELQAKEIVFAQPLRKMPYGTEFYIADPDGNLIAFME